MVVQCGSAEEATNFKTALQNCSEANNLKISDADIHKTKIVIQHVPMHIMESNISEKIKTVLQLGNIPGTLDQIKIKGKRETTSDTQHWIIEMPTPLSSALLRKNTIIFGVKHCPVRHYVSIIKCHKCLRFDHIAAQCDRNSGLCANCGSHAHAETDCNAVRSRWFACRCFNDHHRNPTHRVDERHHSLSAVCPTLRYYRRVRQLELQMATNAKSNGTDVVKGRVEIVRGSLSENLRYNREATT